MSKIARTASIIEANPNATKPEILEMIVQEFGIKKSESHSYYYHGMKKIANRDGLTKPERKAKAPKAPKVKATKADIKAQLAPDTVDAIKAANLKTIKTVANRMDKIREVQAEAQQANTAWDDEVTQYLNENGTNAALKFLGVV